ncbi:MAG: adenosylcobinamide kinase [Clostridiales bacterium]|nr:adenosylcobinamide kinase [Clostridiales bacterium]
MKLYIGGAYQGQQELAELENEGAIIMSAFHEKVREILAQETDPREFALQLCITSPDAVIVSDEIGSGIVPISAEERAWREAVGRALCIIAQHSQSVTRVVCGIGVRIK